MKSRRTKDNNCQYFFFYSTAVILYDGWCFADWITAYCEYGIVWVPPNFWCRNKIVQGTPIYPLLRIITHLRIALFAVSSSFSLYMCAYVKTYIFRTIWELVGDIVLFLLLNSSVSKNILLYNLSTLIKTRIFNIDKMLSSNPQYILKCRQESR